MCSLVLLAGAAVVAVGYLARAVAPRFARVERDGGSALLGASVMNAGYWALAPCGAALARAGVTAHAITLASLALGAAAGVAVALGHFGVAAALGVLAASGDVLDGFVARATHTESDAGALLDASVDRYEEFAFFAGLAIYLRDDARQLALVLAALLGAFATSYASAQAQALRVEAPRGVMRRPERAVYLLVAFALTPVAERLRACAGLGPLVARLPLLLALALIAVLANGSAVHRLVAMMARLRARSDAPTRPAPTRPSVWRLLYRHQLVSFATTCVDFGAMIASVELAHTGPVPGTVVGAMLGAATNFTLGRHWIFRSTSGRVVPQALRYAAVSLASLALNAAGEYLVAVRLGVPYVVARIGVAAAISVLWNFPMQRHFVFALSSEGRT